MRYSNTHRAGELFFVHDELAELEAFLESSDSTEHDASRLFTRFPKFLLLGSGVELHREVVLKDHFRVDFFRREYGAEYWDLIELKTPQTPLVVNTTSAHPRLSQKVTQAISQAQDYRQWISQNPDARAHLLLRGIRVEFPRIIVIVGRGTPQLSGIAHALLDRAHQAGVAVLSYDHLARFAREHYRSHKYISIPAYVPSFRDVELTARLTGLDRVRLYAYDEQEQVFIGHSNFGPPLPAEFSSVRVPVKGNPYLTDIVNTVLNNPGPRFVRVDDPCPEPQLLKERPQPFLIVPLLLGEHLCGQIAVDNAPSGRDITPDTLESLTLLGRLAAPLMAREARRSEDRTTEPRPIGSG